MTVELEWNQVTLTLVVKGTGEIPSLNNFTDAKIINVTGSFTSSAFGAFTNYQKLEEIYLPDSIVNIQNYFIYYSRVKQIFIPKGVQEISSSQPFDYNFFLHDFYVDGDNQNFSSIDGVLFSKDHKMMMFYPTGRKESTYSIPEGTETLFRYVFDSCPYLKHIILPTTLYLVNGIAYNLVSMQSVIALRCTKDPLPPIIENAPFFSSMDSYKAGILYSYNYFTYTIILDKQLVISPCTRNGIFYCSFNSTVFENNQMLEEIIINEGITSICSNAFSGCSKLNMLSIPSTISEISPNSFLRTGLGKCSRIVFPISKYSLLLSSGIAQISFAKCVCTTQKVHHSFNFSPAYLFLFISK